jgi:hypothetical protein
MVDIDRTILTRITAVRATLLQEAENHGYFRSPRRYLWEQAKGGWVQTAEVVGTVSDTERQQFSRAIRRLVEAGILESQYHGRSKEIRVPPPPKTRRSKR